MKGIILLNGVAPEKVNVGKDDFVVCADGAYEWAKGKNIKIDLLVGDFDSLGYIPDTLPVLRFPVEKNETDGEIAVSVLEEKGVKQIDVYGAFGKRADHFFGNVALLDFGLKKGIEVKLIDDFQQISIKQGVVREKVLKNGTISLVPFDGDAHIINSKGLFYPLDDLVLQCGSTRGISNKATEEVIEFEVKSGKVLMFESWRD